jgi:hypothetical protein
MARRLLAIVILLLVARSWRSASWSARSSASSTRCCGSRSSVALVARDVLGLAHAELGPAAARGQGERSARGSARAAVDPIEVEMRKITEELRKQGR